MEGGGVVVSRLKLVKLNSIASTTAEVSITKTHLYNFESLKSHFYIVKLRFTGVYLIFLFLLKNIDCGYS